MNLYCCSSRGTVLPMETSTDEQVAGPTNLYLQTYRYLTKIFVWIGRSRFATTLHQPTQRHVLTAPLPPLV